MFSVSRVPFVRMLRSSRSSRMCSTSSNVLEEFELLRTSRIDEFNSTGNFYKHNRTGAEVLSIQSNENNKVFAISFNTLPSSSNGVAHILEHSVFCGSRKYPVKEPFVEMMKSSVQTYLNAMTMPDRTLYPVASPNEVDFYNLVDVYLDAVFYPRLSPLTLAQEGWRYEYTHEDTANEKRSLEYKGVVFNEMKGVYSSPEFYPSAALQKNLFPDVPYRHNSGGDPMEIPDLSHEEFIEFHKRFYHPTNAKIFFFGNDSEEKRLAKLHEYLKDFDKLPEGATVIQHQQPFTQPRRFSVPYPHTQEECDKGVEQLAEQSEGDKHFVSVAWALDFKSKNSEFDTIDQLGLQIISHLLMGNETAVLAKKLVDSKLGTALFGSGLDESLSHGIFDTGLKGVASADVPRVEELVESTLHSAAENGFKHDHVQATLNTIEFALKELASADTSLGLTMFMSCSSDWTYGKDPINTLKCHEPFAACKERIQQDPQYLQKLLRRALIENPHKVVIHAYPDSNMPHEVAKKETDRLHEVAASLSPEEHKTIMETSEQLELQQTTPDTPEALATIPRLHVQDLDRKAPEYTCQVEYTSLSEHVEPYPRYMNTRPSTLQPFCAWDAPTENPRVPVFVSEQHTNGIIYTKLGFDVSVVPATLRPLLPILSSAFTNLPTSKYDEVELAHKIGMHTGDIGASISSTSTYHDRNSVFAQLSIDGKSTANNVKTLADLVHNILLETNFSSADILATRLLTTLDQMEQSIISSAQSYMCNYLLSQFTLDGALQHDLSGLGSYKFLKQLVHTLQTSENASEVFEIFEDSLDALRDLLINSHNVMVLLTADSANIDVAHQEFGSLLKSLPVPCKSTEQRAIKAGENLMRMLNIPMDAHATLSVSQESHARDNLAFSIPSQVNYVCQMMPLYDQPVHGSATTISNLLSNTLMWDRIRLQNGAYGASAQVDPITGLLQFASYRDPSLSSTLAAYNESSKFIRTLAKEMPEEELQHSIISTIGSIDVPVANCAKGSIAVRRLALGLNQDDIQRRRDEILSTSRKDLITFADHMEAAAPQTVAAVAGSEQALLNDPVTKTFRCDRL